MFPVHAAIVTNTSALLDNMLETFLPASDDGSSGGGGGGAGRPRIVLKSKGAGTASAGEGAAQQAEEAPPGASPAAAPPLQASEMLSPHKLRLFLSHVYQPDKIISEVLCTW